MFEGVDTSVEECRSRPVSSRKFQAAGVCLESEDGNARDTRLCFTVEEDDGNGAVNENVEAEGSNIVGSAGIDIVDEGNELKIS